MRSANGSEGEGAALILVITNVRSDPGCAFTLFRRADAVNDYVGSILLIRQRDWQQTTSAMGH